MKISVRQICFILFAYTVATRLLLYPNMLSYIAGRDLLFSALIDFGVQSIVVWAVAYLCSKTDKTFFGLLKDTLGEIGARIIYGLFAAFFVLSAIVPMFEQKLYVHAIFYDNVPPLTVFLPFFFFSVYAGCKGFGNIGRAADICFPIFVVSIAFVFAMSVVETDVTNLLPIARTPAKDIFGGALSTAYRFVEPCYLLMFMGHFRYKKHDALKITLSYVAGALLVLGFLAVFYGIYGEISASRQFAVSKVSLYFPAMDIVGRIDLIALYALETVMLFALVLNVQLAVHCFYKCSGWNCPEALSLGVNLVLVTLLITLDHYFHGVQEFFSQWLWIAAVIFAVVAPLSAWALRRRDKI